MAVILDPYKGTGQVPGGTNIQNPVNKRGIGVSFPTQPQIVFGQTPFRPSIKQPDSAEASGQSDPSTAASPLEIFSSFRNELGQAPQVQAPSILKAAGEGAFGDLNPVRIDLPERPEELRGRGQGYYDAEKQRRTQELRDQFFSPFGELNRVSSEAVGKGILDSGVGKKFVQDLAINPFLQAFSGIQRDVAQEQMEERAQLEQLNAQRLDNYATNLLTAQGMNADQVNQTRDFLGALAQADSTNATTAAIANAKIGVELDNIAASLTESTFSTLTSAEIQAVQQRINSIMQALDIQDEFFNTGFTLTG